MGLEPYLLADALAMSQAQRLCRRLCSYCKQPMPVTPEIQDFLFQNNVIKSGHVFSAPYYVAAGCPECNGSGYAGRVALMEMCMINPELSSMIAENAPVNKMREVAMKDGFLSLYQEGLMHVMAGNTSFEEIACLSYTSPIKLSV
jgi:type II secretory ATPase GspE/PulE/Tfp pilus assembly ATPase PilB-like protein